MWKKLTLEQMREIATERKGRCLSPVYTNANSKLLWECEKGHQWEAVPGSIKSGRWCPYCAGKHITINDVQKLAEANGGKCLSENYMGIYHKMLFQCSKGHQCEASFSKIKTGHWCHQCKWKQKLSLELFQILAASKGGKCLSDKYCNVDSKLRWECANGHQWETIPSVIRRGGWCKICSRKLAGVKSRMSLDKIRNIAIARGGKCLSNSYKNNLAKLYWECEKGHRWKASYGSIKSGSWCPECGNLRKGALQRLTIDACHKLADQRGGRCLSSSYENNSTKMLWECVNGHKWKAGYNTIKNGSWCPECSFGLGERICRTFFEQIFEKPFPRCFPVWLINDRGNQLELDGYCEEIGIAFEHQGRQHYTIDNPFFKDQFEFDIRKKDDDIKRKLCKTHGVYLFEIPEIPSILELHQIKPLIKLLCKTKNISLPNNFEDREVVLKDAYSPNNLKILISVAQSKNGKLLSSEFLGWKTKLEWECSNGHRWMATPDNVKRGSWCQLCANKYSTDKMKLSIEDIQISAQDRGGKCLSQEYINSETKMLFECHCGCQWWAKPNNVRNGKWCPKCAGNLKSSLHRYQLLAESYGGKCLAESYINAHSILLWQCKHGHQWFATPNKIQQGSWCLECSGRKKGTIEDMKALALKHGGTCLSDNYLNINSKLLWKCAKGHTWEATPNKIKYGTWCPICSKNIRTSNQLRS